MFALRRFTGSSYRELSISAEIIGTFHLSQSFAFGGITLTNSLFITSTMPGTSLDCQQQQRCFTLAIPSGRFELDGVSLHNGSATNGGLITASKTRVVLRSLT